MDRRSDTLGSSAADGHRVVSVLHRSSERAKKKAVTTMINLNATVTCPHCKANAAETMPTNRCQFFYECPNCHTVLRPKPGDCCVYCSYADRPCPSAQQSRTSFGCAVRELNASAKIAQGG